MCISLDAKLSSLDVLRAMFPSACVGGHFWSWPGQTLFARCVFDNDYNRIVQWNEKLWFWIERWVIDLRPTFMYPPPPVERSLHWHCSGNAFPRDMYRFSRMILFLSLFVNMRPNFNNNPQGSKKMWPVERWKAIELSEICQRGFVKEITVKLRGSANALQLEKARLRNDEGFIFTLFIGFSAPSILCKRTCIDFYNHLCTLRQLYDRTRRCQMIDVHSDHMVQNWI